MYYLCELSEFCWASFRLCHSRSVCLLAASAAVVVVVQERGGTLYIELVIEHQGARSRHVNGNNKQIRICCVLCCVRQTKWKIVIQKNRT